MKNILNEKVDNRVNVIDADGHEVNPTYTRRARGLVKDGRAEWLDDKTIRLLRGIEAFNKDAYRKHLSEKGKKQAIVDEWMSHIDNLEVVFEHNPVTPDAIPIFIERIRPWGHGAVSSAYQFLADYTKFIEAEQPLLADTIRMGCRQILAQTAKDFAHKCRQRILSIPLNAKIDPKHLNGLTNEQFVKAFSELQQFVIACYDDIVKDPFAWGYPDFHTTDGHFNRVNDILFALVFCGEHNNGTLTVNGKTFFANVAVKRHKLVELMVTGFEKLGLKFEGFDKKADTFTVTHAANPYIVTALNAYVHTLDWSLPSWRWGKAHMFSYRFIEDPAVQEYEAIFLAHMDYASPKLLEIQQYLHAEAAKCGFKIDPNEPQEKRMMLYKKGSKRWLLVGEDDGVIKSKAIFRDVFTKEPEKIRVLAERFPETFQTRGHNQDEQTKCCKPYTTPCSMRISYEIDGKKRHSCSYNAFWFNNPTLDDVKLILELFKLENNIKPI